MKRDVITALEPIEAEQATHWLIDRAALATDDITTIERRLQSVAALERALVDVSRWADDLGLEATAHALLFTAGDQVHAARRALQRRRHELIGGER